MPKAIVLSFEHAMSGASANEFVLKAKVVFTGLPGNAVDVDTGDDDSGGVSIPINITNLAQYANAIEDALIARGVQLGITLLRTDCLFPTYTRGA